MNVVITPFYSRGRLARTDTDSTTYARHRMSKVLRAMYNRRQIARLSERQEGKPCRTSESRQT